VQSERASQWQTESLKKLPIIGFRHPLQIEIANSSKVFSIHGFRLFQDPSPDVLFPWTAVFPSSRIVEE
jgi:hypothetical protein